MAGKEQKEEKDFQLISGILTKFPDGASLEQVHTALEGQISERTLHRRLDAMGKKGMIKIMGQSRATKYQLVKVTTRAPESGSEATKIKTEIPLSQEAESILGLIRQPIVNRTPVGYDPEFLRSYTPNQTFYLSNEERARLHMLGRTAQLAQPAGTYARHILQQLLIDLSWNSSRLEGNNYSLLDTRELISGGRASSGKSPEETQMILNHKQAIEFIVESAEDVGFNRYTMMNLHAILSDNLLLNPAASGRLRTIAVDIGDSLYRPTAIPQLIGEMFDMLLEKASQIEDPFEQSFFVMVQLPYLQPFEDVNKRVSRLAANIPLTKNNLVPQSFIDVPKDLYALGLMAIYELKKVELFKEIFLWSYNRSANHYAVIRPTLGEPDEFRLNYREDLRGLVREIIVGTDSVAEAKKNIEAYAERIPPEDRTKFKEVVEQELYSLHEGNFARYRVTPSQYNGWKRGWDKK
jgi:hypothetical protein